MSVEVWQLTLDGIVQRLSERRWLSAGIFFAAVLGGVLLAWLSPKIYRADALLAPNREVASDVGGGSMLGSLGSIASLSGLLEPGQTITGEAIATLRSRAFLQKFIEDEDLLPILYEKDWDPVRRKWKPEILPAHTAGRAWKKLRDDVLRIKEVSGEDLYEVSVEWGDPKLPAIWLDALIKRLNQEMRSREMKEANDVLQFLRTQVEQTATVEIRAALFRFSESQLRRAAIANVRQDYAFRVLDPPFASEPDQFVRPRRVILIALSIIFGFAAGVVAAVVAPKRKGQA
jgi:uncharacterized protein involved in exopolysaccharide biosynthesis